MNWNPSKDTPGCDGVVTLGVLVDEYKRLYELFEAKIPFNNSNYKEKNQQVTALFVVVR